MNSDTNDSFLLSGSLKLPNAGWHERRSVKIVLEGKNTFPGNNLCGSVAVHSLGVLSTDLLFLSFGRQ